MPHVLQILEATEGGTRRHLRDLTLGLLARGWKVSLAVSCGRDPDFAESDIPLLRDAGADVHVVPMSRGIAPFRDFTAWRRIAALVRELRPDVVHAHSSKAGMLGRIVAHSVGIPVVYTPHGFSFEMDVSPAKRAAYRAMERLAAGWTNALVAVCGHEAELARGLSRTSRVATVYNGVEPDCGYDCATSERRCDAVFVGRFCRQKAPDIFLAACERVRGNRPDSRFAIMGSGKLDECGCSKELRLLSGSLDVLPRGGRSEVSRLLREAKVLVMPSRWEGFPYLVLEAMAAGTPIVASDVGGVGEAVRDGREALLVPKDDVGAVSVAVERLLDEPELRGRLVAAAQERVKRFSLGAMVDGIECVYRDVVRNA